MRDPDRRAHRLRSILWRLQRLQPVDLHKHLLLSRQGVGKHHVLSHIVCRWGVQLCYCAGLKHEPVDLPLYLMIAYGGEWEVNGRCAVLSRCVLASARLPMARRRTWVVLVLRRNWWCVRALCTEHAMYKRSAGTLSAPPYDLRNTWGLAPVVEIPAAQPGSRRARVGCSSTGARATQPTTYNSA